MAAKFFEEVGRSLGDDAVNVDLDARREYGHNRLPGSDRCPDGIVYPASTEDVQELVRLARQHGVSLWPTSTGQNLGLGEFSPVREGQVVVHLGDRMNRVLEINETLGYAVIEPGVTFEHLRTELKKGGDKFMMSSTTGPPEGSVLGNAMDRGAGYTPYFDHFAMLFGLEVVLADGSVLRTGDGALAGSQNRFLNKSGFGPLLDGLFSQSNFGIATQSGLWLMPRPPEIRSFIFTFPDDEDLAEIIELVRPLKLANRVPTLVKVTSGLYGLATEAQYPFDRTDGETPLPDAVRRELQEEYGTGAWTVAGAFYGPNPEAVEPMIDRIREHFSTSGKARYVDHEEAFEHPIFRIQIDSFSGEPTSDELGLMDWRPGGGATWFLPATPMAGPIAQRHQEVSRRVLTEHGFEYIVEFVCGPRAARALHILVFNREDPDERARAHACFRALIAAYDEMGYPVGRMPIDSQEEAMERLPELANVCRAIKQALDPDQVIAPGKYGITS